jgi:polyisoprenyl-teichoic acid--peptidoglycan teichoic acid transferase
MNNFARFFALLLLSLAVFPAAAQDSTDVPPGEMPPPMTLANEGLYDIVNFLLLGSDTTNPSNAGRTDVMMIVSVNRTAGTVSLLSIPRDLWVYIPDFGMQRINTAYGRGEHDENTETSGADLLEASILYNLGISIDYYARVDFNGFKQIVDNVGGVEISVDCTIQDWRLKSPELDPQVEDSWEVFTLPVGVHDMDGNLALWYVRSRRTSSDFDRGRRQQDMMRALWRRVRTLGLLNQLTDLWPQVLETVDTNISLDEALNLVPLALNGDSTHIGAYTFHLNTEVSSWRSPEGAAVLLPIHDAVADLVRRFMLPPTDHQIVREHATIEVVNASGVPGFDQVAADRLAVEGFAPHTASDIAPYQNYTMIYDYTGQTKGRSLDTLKHLLRVSDAGVVLEPDPARAVDFRVVIGGSYNACTYGVMAPSPIETPQPIPAA